VVSRHDGEGVFVGHPSGLVVERFHISLVATTRVDVQDGPLYRTATGQRPIVVRWVEFSHSLSEDAATVQRTHGVVGGMPEPGAKWAQSRRFPGTYLRRSFELNEGEPDWLHDLAQQTLPVCVRGTA
jgi:hypothetical protein